MTTLRFLGATQQVTGSCYLLESKSFKVLLECGMIQSEHKPESASAGLFSFDPQNIDAVVLSHAHLDHSGLLPALVREGYRGPVYVTTPTQDLLEVMLKDAAFIQQKDIEWENKKRLRSGKQPIEPVYDIDDVEQALTQVQALDYAQRSEIIQGVELSFRDAGHILGSSLVELFINESGAEKKLVFSGDLVG